MVIYRQCPKCDYRTEKASTMSMHLSMKHKNKRKHKCTICYETFAQKTTLTHHYVNNHTKPDIHCAYPGCDKTFHTDCSHKIHYTRKHMKNIELFVPTSFKGFVKCVECNFECKTAAMFYHVANCSCYSPFTDHEPEPESEPESESEPEPIQPKESWEYDFDNLPPECQLCVDFFPMDPPTTKNEDDEFMELLDDILDTFPPGNMDSPTTKNEDEDEEFMELMDDILDEKNNFFEDYIMDR